MQIDSDLVFAFCMSNGMEVPSMEKWDTEKPTEQMIEFYKSAERKTKTTE